MFAKNDIFKDYFLGFSKINFRVCIVEAMRGGNEVNEAITRGIDESTQHFMWMNQVANVRVAGSYCLSVNGIKSESPEP